MRNNYDSAEINEVGRAQDVILGSKPFVTPYDSDEDQRQVPIEDDDE